ncbi:MAG: EF-hand domain-containing protein [Betaproteobacteria bacterium]|nr:EF-hand domain-containing protein [Betaproteobacteria bacterium]
MNARPIAHVLALCALVSAVAGTAHAQAVMPPASVAAAQAQAVMPPASVVAAHAQAVMPPASGAAAHAQAVMPPATVAAVPRGPWVPPALRSPAQLAAPTRGAALQAQVQRKLQADFERAAQAGGGRLTRAQAQAAGLGYVAQHFDAIDVQHTGSVSPSDWQRYLQARQAAPAR